MGKNWKFVILDKYVYFFIWCYVIEYCCIYVYLDNVVLGCNKYKIGGVGGIMYKYYNLWCYKESIIFFYK